MTWEDFERTLCWMVFVASSVANPFSPQHTAMRLAHHRRWPR